MNSRVLTSYLGSNLHLQVDRANCTRRHRNYTFHRFARTAFAYKSHKFEYCERAFCAGKNCGLSYRFTILQQLFPEQIHVRGRESEKHHKN